MLTSSRQQHVLDFVEPFRVGSGKRPDASELAALDALIEELAREIAVPDLGHSIQSVGGMWECVFTTSRFVLDLDKIPGLRVSSVYQQVSVDRDGRAGDYFNIAEMSRGGRVRVVCGEHAAIRPSGVEPGQIEVQYQWFYFAIRVFRAYEGADALAKALRETRLRGEIRLPFRRSGWQKIVYVDSRLRIVRGSQGGLFVLVKR